MQTYHMACTETGLKMCCRPQTLTLKPLLNKNRRKKRAQLGRRHRISIPHVDSSLIDVLVPMPTGSTHPSPSSLIAVSARTRNTSPTVVFSLQSMPSKHDSSISLDELRLQLLPTFDSVSHWLSHRIVLSSSIESLSHAVILALKREPPLLVASLK